MAIQLINIGNIANDGTGDDLREAFIKANSNFEELDLRDDEKTTASNLGDSGQGLFVQRLNYDLQFKKIAPGPNVTITADAEGNHINVNVPSIGVESVSLGDGSNSITVFAQGGLNVVGGDDITTTLVDNGQDVPGTLTIDYTGASDLASDLTPQLSNNLDANGFGILGLSAVTVAGDITALQFKGEHVGATRGFHTGDVRGNLYGNVRGVDVEELYNQYFAPGTGDFGGLDSVANNAIEFIIFNSDVDFGTITAPAATSLDGGAL